MQIPLELTEVRWSDLLGFEDIVVGFVEPVGEPLQVTAVVGTPGPSFYKSAESEAA